MAIAPNTPEFNLLFILVIIVLIVKSGFTIYLGNKVLKRKKETGKLEIDFLFSIFILGLCAVISRIILTYYDFFLVQFDENRLWIYPNVIYWKISTLISSFGLVLVLYTIDKKVLKNKFKGILAYYALTVLLIQFFWPVNIKTDFEFVSSLIIYGLIAFAVIPIIFLYLAIKTPGLRNVCLLMFFGILIYAGGSFLVGETVLDPIRDAFGEQVDFPMYVIFYISKIIGISMLALGVTRFSM
jgi:hypothetical protein